MISVQEFLATHIETITFCASILATLFGTIALVVIWRFWSWLEPHYQEHWPKIAIAVFRAVAALAAVATKSTVFDKTKSTWEQPWFATIIIAAIGYLLWEIAGAYGDQRHKRSKEQKADAHTEALNSLKQELLQARKDQEFAEFQVDRREWLLALLRESVHFKRQRIQLILKQNADTRTSIAQVRSGLRPYEQVRILLEAIATMFRLQASPSIPNFRIGLFVAKEGVLAPHAAFDLATKSHNPYSSYEKHVDRYRLDNSNNPACVVRCIQESRMLIVTDCACEPDFYFHDKQPQYLRSMVAYPIAGFCPDGLTPAIAAFVIDTNQPGFFRQDDKDIIQLQISEFVARIDLEYAIGGITGESPTELGAMR